MKLRPVAKNSKPDYPSTLTYSRFRSTCLGAAVAAGIGVGVAGLMPLPLKADDEVEVKTEKADKGEKEEAKAKAELKKKIDELVAQLGHKTFKTRQEATVKLMALGNKKDEEGNCPNREPVLTSVKPLLKSSDPEVVTRANKIVKALSAEKKTGVRRIGGRPQAAGLMAVE